MPDPETPITTIKNPDVPLPLGKDIYACPGGAGGVEWFGPAYDPALKGLFVGSVDWCSTFKLAPADRKPGSWYAGGTAVFDSPDAQRGWLYALDAESGAVRWSYHAERPMVGGITRGVTALRSTLNDFDNTIMASAHGHSTQDGKPPVAAS